MSQLLTVETYELSKVYSNGRTAVNNVNFSASQGEVVGLVGHNGAGKTTLLRMLLGLISPSNGSISILGHQPGSELGLAGVGSMIEAPAFYPYLSGRDNLLILADYCSISSQRVGEVLEMSGLGDRANDRTHTYSMGMKQRLGVAAALLKRPPLLILDEPTNGLDQEGIELVYQIIQQYREEGNTVLFSSHQIGDVAKICDRVCVFRQGKIVANQASSDYSDGCSIRLHVQPLDRAINVLSSFYGPSIVSEYDGRVWVRTDRTEINNLAKHLIDAETTIYEIIEVNGRPEDAIIALMDGTYATPQDLFQ